MIRINPVRERSYSVTDPGPADALAHGLSGLHDTRATNDRRERAAREVSM